MLFSSIPGLQDLKDKLIQSARNNQLAHALLLYGPAGSGTLSVALALSTYLFCEDKRENDACGTCSSCQKMAKLIHPDLNFTFPSPSKDTEKEKKDEKNTDIMTSWRDFAVGKPYGNLQDWIAHNSFTKQLNISKNAARQIIQALSLKSFEGGYKIILIWHPEFMNIAAANALLKVLEEPPAKTLFLLVAHQPEQLLNTILSRTQKISVRGFTETEISDHLVAAGLCTPEMAKQVAPMADGSIREAYHLLEKGPDENTAMFRDWMRMCYSLKIKEIVSFYDSFDNKDKETPKGLLLTGLNTLRESLLNKNQLDKLMRIDPADRDFVEKFAENVLTEEKIVALYNLFNQAHYHLERNANIRILFADLSFNAARVLRKDRK